MSQGGNVIAGNLLPIAAITQLKKLAVYIECGIVHCPTHISIV
jgi:hypothetical protein